MRTSKDAEALDVSGVWGESAQVHAGCPASPLPAQLPSRRASDRAEVPAGFLFEASLTHSNRQGFQLTV